MFTMLFLATVLAADSDNVSVKFIGSGATEKVGGYRPIRAEMDGKADAVKKAPEGISAPKYGVIKIGESSWQFILDEPEGKPQQLYVDTNRDGDLTNDPKVEWKARTVGERTMYEGKAQVDLGDSRLGTLGMYRFDPTDPQRAPLKNTILYYTDYGFELTLNLDNEKHSTFAPGQIEGVRGFWIDRDGNGQRSNSREMVEVGKPFNFTGTTYVLNIKDGKPSLDKATESLPQSPLPPNLVIGQKAIPFKAEATDGMAIDFPKSYAGKIVMLDFWATWCGPCIAELPNLKAAYEKHHDAGFDVLGISFDQAEMGEKLAAFTKQREMPWRQIYEGKFWNTTLGELYDVTGIPFVLLVDGDSGEILGTARELRGPGLTEFVGKALTKKKATVNE